jgi:hypothetical protein
MDGWMLSSGDQESSKANERQLEKLIDFVVWHCICVSLVCLLSSSCKVISTME